MDMDHQADEAWILGIQSKLYQWSWGSLTSPCLLESRMLNESRKSGSGRGGKKPVAEKRYGACRLLLLATLDLSAIYGSYEAKDGRGQAAYSPEMMLRVLLYGYSTGVYSSRKIETRTYEDVAFLICLRTLIRITTP
jgi:hypothetical protein